MTLRRQLLLSLTALLVILLGVSMTVSLYKSSQHLQQQMTSHAQDTADTLAFALSQSIRDSKAESIEPVLNTVFGRGHFSSILYRDIQGAMQLERRQPVQAATVPAWFTALFPLDTRTVSAEVMSGWSQLGNVEITVNPDHAYQKLWVSFREQLAVFGIACIIANLLCNMAITILLRPLQRVEQQAASICERHFVEQQPLPRTRELRRVVEAINRMSRKLKVIFQEQLALTESLRAQSHLDPVTGLSNRREFNARLQAVTDSETGNGGCLMILQVSDFGRYNLQHSHETGDECLRAIASQLLGLTADAADAIISRRAGADFAIYLPRITQERVKALAANLIATIGRLDLLYNHPIHIGAACCDVLRADHRLLAEADLALRQAQSRGHSDWQLYAEGDIVQVAREARHWHTTLSRVLQDRHLTFHYQPIFRCDEKQAMAAEIFCRITMQEKLVNAGIFLPMAERFGMAEAFDRLILDQVRLQSESVSCDTAMCINLSPHSVRSAEFREWLSLYLGEHPGFASKLILETSEYLVRTGADHVHQLCAMLHSRGARLSLDHFGIHSAAFGYLHSLPLDMLKIDQSFIRDIHLNKDNQFYVQSLVQIAHSCDIIILAESVENGPEWDCLRQLGIDGGQGYLLGRPDSKINTARP